MQIARNENIRFNRLENQILEMDVMYKKLEDTL